MSFPPGTTLGDYEVLGTLGAGGQGAVYRVRHVISQREEALKILLPDLQEAADLADRFVREIQVLARLNHPNIAALHTALKLQNQLLMVMELVEGVSLRDKLRTSGISVRDGINYMTQVLAALDYAHRQRVIHRDIKPSNIMISPSGDAKLLDFGIASGDGQSRLTRTGAAVGSIHYMSPEQIRGEAADPRSDIYAAAVTLWEIAAGRRPFEAEGEYAVMMAHLEDDPVPPPDRAGVPNALWEILRLALAKKPAHRFQTAADFRHALQSLTDVASAIPTVTTLAPAAPATTSTTDPQILEHITKQLAVYVGPIAKILVKRNAAKTQDLGELYDSLAREITSTRDRERFLAALKKS